MSMSRVFLVTSPILILGVILSACADDRGSSMSTSAQDANTTAAVQSAIAQHRDLGPPNQIEVATRDNVVYLSGIVDSGLVNAKDVARQVDGVTRVVSNISVSR